jgi:hypothetical protein
MSALKPFQRDSGMVRAIDHTDTQTDGILFDRCYYLSLLSVSMTPSLDMLILQTD